ncbi:MAG: helix-turn-helix domain-containing protein, partial [Leadbetterella sp.]
MPNHNKHIPNYTEINDFLASISSVYTSKNPLLYCLKIEANSDKIVSIKSPYRKEFYFFSLITNAKETEISYDSSTQLNLDSFLAFQSPGQIYSFNRNPKAHGYVVYFKKEVFDFFKPDFEQTFSFFNPFKKNFFSITNERFHFFSKKLKAIFQEYDKAIDGRSDLVSFQLLALLEELKQFVQTQNQLEQSFQSPNELLFRNFHMMVNRFYLTKKTVDEYAELLNVSSNHLSKTIKQVSGINALHFISERLVSEAKSLIQFTSSDIVEIAYQLNFSDAANFGKFFKKHTGISPLEHRKSVLS